MLGIIALALVVIIALSVIGFAMHFLFTPWLLVAIVILAWLKFRPHSTRR